MIYKYFLVIIPFIFARKLVSDYPTLPTLWTSETIEPGAPDSGKGIESYNFVDKPTDDNPSALWSNYTGRMKD